MTLYHDGAQCDNCGEFESVYTGGNAPAYIATRIKGRGWVIKRVGGLFKHYCPKCVKADE